MAAKRAICSVAAVLIGLAIAGAYFAFRADRTWNSSLTTETRATIEEVEVRRGVDPVLGAEKTVDVSVRYRYSVNGVEYRRTTTMSSLSADQFVPWSTAKVCYNAQDLATVEAGQLFPPSHKCGDE